MERETKKFTTPSGKEIIIKAYWTARERNAVQSGILEQVQVTEDMLRGGQVAATALKEAASHLSAAKLTESHEHSLMKTMITKYGDLTDGEAIIEALLDEDPAEYDFVYKTVGEAARGFLTAK